MRTMVTIMTEAMKEVLKRTPVERWPELAESIGQCVVLSAVEDYIGKAVIRALDEYVAEENKLYEALPDLSILD